MKKLTLWALVALSFILLFVAPVMAQNVRSAISVGQNPDYLTITTTPSHFKVGLGASQSGAIVADFGASFGPSRRHWVSLNVGERWVSVEGKREVASDKNFSLLITSGVEGRKNANGYVQISGNVLSIISSPKTIKVRPFVGLDIEVRDKRLGSLSIRMSGRLYIWRPENIQRWAIEEAIVYRF